jgi:hypothetical protein
LVNANKLGMRPKLHGLEMLKIDVGRIIMKIDKLIWILNPPSLMMLGMATCLDLLFAGFWIFSGCHNLAQEFCLEMGARRQITGHQKTVEIKWENVSLQFCIFS